MIEWTTPPFTYNGTDYNHDNMNNGIYIRDISRRNSDELLILGYFWSTVIYDNDYSVYTYSETTQILTLLTDELYTDLTTVVNANSPDPNFTFRNINSGRITSDGVGILVHLNYRLRDSRSLQTGEYGSATYYVSGVNYDILFETFSNGCYLYYKDVNPSTGAEINPRRLYPQYYLYVEETNTITRCIFQKAIKIPSFLEGVYMRRLTISRASFAWLDAGQYAISIIHSGVDYTEVKFTYSNLSYIDSIQSTCTYIHYGAGTDAFIPLEHYKFEDVYFTEGGSGVPYYNTLFYQAPLKSNTKNYFEYSSVSATLTYTLTPDYIISGTLTETLKCINVDFGSIAEEVTELTIDTTAGSAFNTWLSSSKTYHFTGMLLHKDHVYSYYDMGRATKEDFFVTMYSEPAWEDYPEDLQDWYWSGYGSVFVEPKGYNLSFYYTDYPDSIDYVGTFFGVEEYYLEGAGKTGEIYDVSKAIQLDNKVYINNYNMLYCLEYFPQYKVEPSSISIDFDTIHIGGRSVMDFNTVSGIVVTSGLIYPYAVYSYVEIPPITTTSGDYTETVFTNVHIVAPSGISYVKSFDSSTVLVHGEIIPFRALLMGSAYYEDISFDLPSAYTSASVEYAENVLLCGTQGNIFKIPDSLSGTWTLLDTTDGITSSIRTFIGQLYVATPGGTNSLIRTQSTLLPDWEAADSNLPAGITILDLEEEAYADR